MRKHLITVTAILLMVLFCQTVVAANNTTTSNTTTILVIGSSRAAKSYNEVAHSIMNLTDNNVKFQIRSTSQIGNMTSDEIQALLNSSQIILAEWGTPIGW
ncbi:MAG TPA: hypothetical protein PLE91_05770 [Methanothermobacter sp.]|nr:hypothetical protein [Methanothermobacter sp.]